MKKVTTKILVWPVLTLLCAVVIGCCHRTNLGLWNATGSAITLHLNGRSHEIQIGGYWGGVYTTQNESAAERLFQIDSSLGHWSYTKKFGLTGCFEPPSCGFCYFYQVEPDGLIWDRSVNTSSALVPRSEMKAQPTGFPVLPEKSASTTEP